MKNKRQHVVPQFHLKEFFPGFVYRKGAQHPRFTKKPGNVSVRSYYYGRPDDDSILPLDRFNSLIEKEAAPIIKRLMVDVTTINRSDWIKLSYFFANMQLMNPSYHESLRETFRQMTDQVSDMVERMKASYEKAKAEGREFPLPMGPTINNERGYSLEEMHQAVEERDAPDGHIKIAAGLYSNIKDVAFCIQKMSLHVLEAPGALFFITTDTPLILYSLNSGSLLGAGWGNQDAMAVIPIHPKYCLVLVYRKEATIYSKVLAADEVHFWNINLMKYASTEIYSKYQYDMAHNWMLQQGIWHKK